MSDTSHNPRWGQPPWTIDFHPPSCALPDKADFAVVGGGFTGLSAAAWLRRLAPQKSVVLFEAASIGAGSSGRTGGMALSESAAGDLPGLGDVLSGFSAILQELEISCDLELPGAWEIGRTAGQPDSPISWQDSGTLRVIHDVPGGSVDAGKLIAGLARAADRAGVQIVENTPVEGLAFDDPLQLNASGHSLRVEQALFASNAQSLELSGLAGHAEPKFTLAVATEPLTKAQFEALGLGSRKSFYTIDFPYLWGRPRFNGGLVFGGGLVHLDDWRDLAAVDVEAGKPAELLNALEQRVHSLHPALRDVAITHKWGGPMLVGERWRPAFRRHPSSSRALVLGAYSGHGVALSVYLGRWAAEAMLGRRSLPAWDEA